MARQRNLKRDSRGRFSRVAGVKVATKTATRAVGRKATAKVRQSYVRGSAFRHLDVGPSGNFKSATVGAELRTPTGRGGLVRGTIGYRGRDDRRLDVSPVLSKQAKTLTVTVRPNSTRKSAPSAKASAGSKTRSAPNKSTGAGTRLRR